MLSATTILSVALICYCLGELIKAKVIKKDEDKALLPYVCALFGGAVSLIGFYTVPEFIGVETPVQALISGIISGALATGGHQFIKQFNERMNGMKANSEGTEE